jgi:hypothetical protein
VIFIAAMVLIPKMKSTAALAPSIAPAM